MASIARDGLDFDKIYPIGSIYISANSTNPHDLFGGTWEQLRDRFLLGCGTKENGAIGGEENHTLTVAESPSHNHRELYWEDGSTYQFGVNRSAGGGMWRDLIIGLLGQIVVKQIFILIMQVVIKLTTTCRHILLSICGKELVDSLI